MRATPDSSLAARIRRLIRFRLFLPMMRSRHSADFTARGVFYGVLIGLTPTVGVQMPIILGIWFLLRSFNRAWDFNLVIAAAWTWCSNALTLPPLYYLFFVTGQVMLGRWDDLAGYDAFTSRLAATMAADASWLEALWVYTYSLFNNFGVPMFMGCIPWAVLGSWIAYRWSFGVINKFHEIRLHRRAARRLRKRQKAVAQTEKELKAEKRIRPEQGAQSAG